MQKEKPVLCGPAIPALELSGMSSAVSLLLTFDTVDGPRYGDEPTKPDLPPTATTDPIGIFFHPPQC
jgi:hypothetical protein